MYIAKIQCNSITHLCNSLFQTKKNGTINRWCHNIIYFLNYYKIHLFLILNNNVYPHIARVDVVYV